MLTHHQLSLLLQSLFLLVALSLLLLIQLLFLAQSQRLVSLSRLLPFALLFGELPLLLLGFLERQLVFCLGLGLLLRLRFLLLGHELAEQRLSLLLDFLLVLADGLWLLVWYFYGRCLILSIILFIGSRVLFLFGLSTFSLLIGARLSRNVGGLRAHLANVLVLVLVALRGRNLLGLLTQRLLEFTRLQHH